MISPFRPGGTDRVSLITTCLLLLLPPLFSYLDIRGRILYCYYYVREMTTYTVGYIRTYGTPWSNEFYKRREDRTFLYSSFAEEHSNYI